MTHNSSKLFGVQMEFFVCFLSVILMSLRIEGAVVANSEENSLKSNSNRQSISLQLIENSSLLFVEFYAKEETLDMTIKFDLEHYKPSLINGDQNSDKSQASSAKSSSSSSGNKDENNMDSITAPSAKKINIGFDFGGIFVDVISVSLMSFEENEGMVAVDQSVINMESPGISVLNDHVQDFHWNKKDGLLVPDLIQNYELVTFDVEKNGSFISTTISRPWLTCDKQDIQFSLESVEIWWMLEMSDSSNNLNQMLRNSIMFENLEEENLGNGTETTVTEPSEIPDENNNEKSTTTVSPPPKNITVIDPTTNSSTSSEGKKNPVEDNPTEDKKEIEILKSIKDHDFHGPLILSMEKLLANFTAVFIRGCPLNNPQQQLSASSLHKLPTKKQKPAQSYIIYNCTLTEYNSKRSEMADSSLKIHGLMSMRKLTPSSSSTSSSSFVEIEAEQCPSSLLLQNHHDHDDMSKTLYHALTGKRDKGIPRQGKNNDNGKRGRESERNSASVISVSTLLFNNFPCHSHSLPIIIKYSIISFALSFFANHIQL